MIRNRVYELTLTTRSPLHIGRGRSLVLGYDFVYVPGERSAYVLDDEVALLVALRELRSRPASDPELDALRRRLLGGLRLDQMLEAGLLDVERHLRPRVTVDDAPLVRYVLRGELSAGQQIGEQSKDAHGRPYLPGSSLKGALRSALAWRHFPESGAGVSLDALANRYGEWPRAERADNNYEDRLFVAAGRGTAAHRDLLRTLQVSDTDTAGVEQLMLAPVSIYTGAVSDDGFDVLNVEAIAPDVTLRGRIQIEQYPFMSRPARERGLDMAARRAWLDELASACRERGQGRIDAELRFFREQGDAALVRFYDGLRQEAHTLDAHSFLLQIGWGGGWGSKTLDDRLSGAEGFAEIVRRYNLDEPRRRGSRFASGDRFPASRKVVLNGGTPWWPLGWARGTVVER